MLCSRYAVLVVLAVAGAAPLAAQSYVDGFVRTPAGAPVAAATVSALRDGVTIAAGVSTDERGYYLLSLEPGSYTLRVDRIGYATTTARALLAAGQRLRLDITVSEEAVRVEGVTVEAQRARARFTEQAGPTTRELSRGELKLIPGLAEADVLRAIEVLPGVVNTSDFSSAFNVRGGSADQNLILLDGIPIFNPFHLGGLFSVFNSDMVARAELTAGGFAAEHGGRVSSVLAVESDAGAGEGVSTSGGVSLLAARAAVGADLPDAFSRAIGLRQSRLRASVRRSYFDQLFRPLFEFPYHLTDLQLLGEGWSHGGGKWTLTGYTGKDVLDFSGVDSFPLRIRWDWGNDLIGTRYLRGFAGGRTLDLRAGFTRFHTAIDFPDFGDTHFESTIGQALARADLELRPRADLDAKLGVEVNHLYYDNAAISGGTEFRRGDESAWLFGAFAQTHWQPANWLIELGARIDAWQASRSSTVFSPRVAVKHFITPGLAAKLAAGRYAQFMHSLRDEQLPIGIDVWVLTGERAPHVISDQLQGGLELFTGSWHAAVEAYYRDFEGVTSNNISDDPNTPDDDLLTGSGTSWGGDLLIQRETGPVNGFVSLSYLRAQRSFPDLDSGIDPPPLSTYAPIFDRRIDLDLVLRIALPRAWQAGLRWNFGTGLPHTRPVSSYLYYEYHLNGERAYGGDPEDPESAIVLGPRNRERYPSYHRLDLSFRKTFEKAWGQITPHFDLLNAYDRRNVLFWFYEYDQRPAVRSGVSMFPILPTIGVEIAF